MTDKRAFYLKKAKEVRREKSQGVKQRMKESKAPSMYSDGGSSVITAPILKYLPAPNKPNQRLKADGKYVTIPKSTLEKINVANRTFDSKSPDHVNPLAKRHQTLAKL